MNRTLANVLVWGGMTVLASAAVVYGQQAQNSKFDIEKYLTELQKEPVRVMNQRLPKYDSMGQVVPVGKDSKFNKKIWTEGKLGGDFVEKKRHGDQSSQRIKGKAPYGWNDRVEELVDLPENEIIRSIQDMDGKLQTQSLKGDTDPALRIDLHPWSDYYWPIYSGILGIRYADPNVDTSAQWPAANRYVTSHPVSGIVNRGNQKEIDALSPSEKYDLLIGNTKPTTSLTSAMWAVGKGYLKNGEVETWMGICHGWAPAAYNEVRPTRPVTVQAFKSPVEITFYPSDLKGLASLMWAEVPNISTRFIGGRCDEKEPETDPKTGRVTNEDCVDTNPGTWHMAVVNQIGKARRSFVLDATYDYEVWNQPILGYTYTYFNPLTNKPGKSLKDDVVVPFAGAMEKKDQFKRNAQREEKPFTHLVGVEMELTYVVETQPDHRPLQDAVRTVTYVYDLEIDMRKNGEIVGGEWYTNLHPDFLWNIPKGGQAITPQEAEFAKATDEPLWESGRNDDVRRGDRKLNSRWADAARRIARNRIPLNAIVKDLLERAK